MPMIMNLLLFSEDEDAPVAPPAKKPRTGSAKSVNTGPEKPKEKTLNAPEPAANALTRMLKRGKDGEAPTAAIAPSSSAAAAALAKEHVSTFCFCF